MTTRTRPANECLPLATIKLKPEITDKLLQFNIKTVHQLTKLNLACLKELKCFKASELVEIRLCLVRHGYALNSKPLNEKESLEYNYLIAISKFLRIQSDINKRGKGTNSFWFKLRKITVDDLTGLNLGQKNKLYYGGYKDLQKILVADYRDIIDDCHNFGKKSFILLVEAIDELITDKKKLG